MVSSTRTGRHCFYPMTDSTPSQAESPADLLLVNGRIATQDDRQSFVSALAIKDGLIHATGDTATLMAYKCPATRVIELNGRTPIPGLIDSHSHPIRGGLHYNLELRWDGVPSLAEAMRMLREQARRTPPNQWVRVIDAGGGFQNYPQDYQVVTELHKDDQLSVRLAANLFTQRPKQELEDFSNWAKTVKPGQGDDRYRINGAGEMLVYSAADFEDFLEPRPDMPASMEADLTAVVRLLAQNRWPFRLHATHDETIGRALDVYEAGDRGVPPKGPNWIIEHP